MSAADTESEENTNRARRLIKGRSVAVCLTLLAAVVLFFYARQLPAEPVAIPNSVAQADYDQAAAMFARVNGRKATPVDTLMLLAENAAKQDRTQVAVDCLEVIPSEHREHGSTAKVKQAQLLLKLNKADHAEAVLRNFLSPKNKSTHHRPEDVRLATSLLVYILAVELRFEERKAVLKQVISEGNFDALDAKQYFFPSLLIWKTPASSQRLREFLAEDPTNPRLLTADARHLTGEGKTNIAGQILNTLRQHDPLDQQVIAASLECCFEESNWTDFDEILAAAPDFSEGEPWLLTQMRAEHAAHHQDFKAAEVLFRKVLESDPSNPGCHIGLTKVLSSLGRDPERSIMQHRSLTLARIRVILPSADNRTPAAIKAVAEAASSLQLSDAAVAFEDLANRLSGRRR